MRDIQAALFETRSRGERVAALLDGRRQALTALVAKGHEGIAHAMGGDASRGEGALFFRGTLMATENLHLRALELSRTGIFARPSTRANGVPSAFGDGAFSFPWTPSLNGTETIDRDSRHFARWFIGDQGVVDVNGFMMLDTFGSRRDVFAPIWFPPVAAQIMALGEVLRRAAGRTDVELVVECEFINPWHATAVFADSRPFEKGTPIPEGSTRIGPFTLGNVDDFQVVYAEIERGIWHGLRMPVTDPITFDLVTWLAKRAA